MNCYLTVSISIGICKNVSNSNAFQQVSNLDSEVGARNRGLGAGQKICLHSQGKGVLLMPVPEAEELFGLAKGANTQNYRDREDRF